MTSRPGPTSAALRRAETALRDFALGYPETHEDMPWGHRAMKVGKKAFVFMGANEGGFFLTAKLPESNVEALDRDFAEPTGYGLGKSGWVTAQFGPRDDVPMDLMRAWIDESFRAVAPKKIVARLDGAAAGAEPSQAKRARAATRKAPARKRDGNGKKASAREATRTRRTPRSKKKS
jgi:predicted DNA-binding protein (MmcQ/YjbR family)